MLRRITGRHREFLLPGALIGIGIASMHYTGDASMRLSPGIQYDPLLFIASVLIAIGAATAALWIAFHLAKQRAVFTNFGAALVMGAAVVGMHFTAVAAAKFHPEAICLASGPGLDEVWMAYTIGGFTFVILTATMLLSAYDARLSAAIVGGAEKLRLANEQLEERVRERTRTLAREGARKDAILRTALDCIISMDERGLIAEWNPAAERTFGYTREEALGRDLADLILPQRMRAPHRANLARYLATGEAKLIGRRIEARAARRGGEEFPVEVRDHRHAGGRRAAVHRACARHHRAQAGRGGAAPLARRGARRLGGEERVRRHHEPRDPHADERDHRHARAARSTASSPPTSARCCRRRANRAARCSR